MTKELELNRALYDALVDAVIDQLGGEKPSAGWGTVALNLLKGTDTLGAIQAEIEAAIKDGDEEALAKREKLRALPFQTSSVEAADDDSDEDMTLAI